MSTANKAFITECPRDAMQGIAEFIPTAEKINYLNQLLDVGFDRLDFGSFVSPKAIPQLRDTAEVLEGLKTGSTTQLLAIVANTRGAEDAARYRQISLIGFPFSISETFQQQNTNSGIAASFIAVQNMMEIAGRAGQELLVYISMAFGNPYNDPWNTDIAMGWINELKTLGINKLALADTVGIASAETVYELTKAVIEENKYLEIGAHLHCLPGNWKQKADAAYRAGCRHFDVALKGFGGCPMAEDELVGNMATENLIQYLTEKNVETRIDKMKFNEALLAAGKLFAF